MKYYLLFSLFTLITCKGLQNNVAIQILKCGNNENRESMIFYTDLQVEEGSFIIEEVVPKEKHFEKEILKVVDCLNEKVELKKVPIQFIYHKYDQAIGLKPLIIEEEFRIKYNLGKNIRLLYFSHTPGMN